RAQQPAERRTSTDAQPRGQRPRVDLPPVPRRGRGAVEGLSAREQRDGDRYDDGRVEAVRRRDERDDLGTRREQQPCAVGPLHHDVGEGAERGVVPGTEDEPGPARGAPPGDPAGEVPGAGVTGGAHRPMLRRPACGRTSVGTASGGARTRPTEPRRRAPRHSLPPTRFSVCSRSAYPGGALEGEPCGYWPHCPAGWTPPSPPRARSRRGTTSS